MNKLIVGITVVVVFALVGVNAFVAYGTVDHPVVVVNEKERVCDGSSSGTTCKYLIYTDKGVFENTDTIWYMKFDSSDVYNDMVVGEKYVAKVNGFRFPLLSMYRNIVSVVHADEYGEVYK